MILHIPHSSVYTGNSVSSQFLQESMNLMTDWYADELFVYEGSDAFIFDHSRLVVDVERFKDDPLDGYGKGYIYKTDVFDAPISRDNTDAEWMYDHHHRVFSSLVSQHLTYFPFVFIVDCHTFNDQPLPWEKKEERPDICIGVDDFHTPAEVVDMLVKYFESFSLSVKINDPYSGTIVPVGFVGMGDTFSIMIEVNKRLYLDDKYQKNEVFDKVRDIITGGLKIIDDWAEQKSVDFWKRL